MRTDFNSINSLAILALPSILSRILPEGKIVSNEYVARNPTRSDRNEGSFKVNLRSGKWADFATDDRGGDIVSLIAFLENISQLAAAHLLQKMLGLTNG